MASSDRNASVERLIGHKRALAEYGIQFDPALVRYTEHKPLAGYHFTLEMLQCKPRPTAFFCGNDRTALECYSALKEMGIRIPEDIAVIGYDNYRDICERLHPPLTTIALPQYEIGAKAMGYLYECVYGRELPDTGHVLIACPPVIRDSV
jgi:LacI family transcriptional regulator